MATPPSAAGSTPGPRRARPGIVRPILVTALLTAAAAATGCAMSPPAAWQKGHVARPDMAMTPDPLASRMQAKLHASKENAAGGATLGGGGCGCN